MFARTAFGLAIAVPTVLAWNQQVGGAPAPAVDAPVLTPVTVSDPSVRTAPPAYQEEELRPSADGGEGRAAPAPLDDSVPLPIPAVVEAAADGDTILQPASGDPFFLGFEAGRHFPPQGEQLDPALIASLRSPYTDGRPDQVTYGFAMFSKRITPERIAELESLGVRVLGFHPHYTLRLAVPTASLDAVVGHDAIRWLGVPRPWQKVHSYLTDQIANHTGGQPLDVYVTVHESDLSDASTYELFGSVETHDGDSGVRQVSRNPELLAKVWQSNGWQQAGLEALGLEIVEYVDQIHAFRARMHPASLEQVVELDYVQFVEADVPVTSEDEESSPMILADRTRALNDGGGNGVAVAGQIDSGYDSSHDAFNGTFAVGWNNSNSALGAFDDLCEHGSAIAGTIHGGPHAGNEAYAGNAPGLGASNVLRYFNVKYFDDACSSNGTSHSTLYSHMRSSFTDGNSNTTPKPHVINCSWSTPGTGWIGSEANARTVDDEIYTNGQLYVFGAGNNGAAGGSSVGLPSVAKNVFTVGNVIDYEDAIGDPGTVWTSSGRGPAGDGRWKPNLTAPGRWIRSVDANSGDGYRNFSGSSLAAPHVTAIAAQMADVLSHTRYQPDRMASLLMAGALTKDDTTLATPSSSSTDHLNMYGAGRLNALRSIYVNSEFDITNYGTTGNPGFWYNDDFEVPVGTTRLIVVMTYHEVSASAGAAQALVNDWDLWLDRSPIDPAGNTGEYFIQQSSIDNTEIRMIDSPAAGTWRWKVWPESVTSTCQISVTLAFILGDTTPGGSLTVSASDVFVQPGDDVDIDATVDSDSYIASSVFLDTTSSGDSLQASTVTLEDGAVADLTLNQHNGRDLTLGSIRHNKNRTASWTTHWNSEGVKSWQVDARSDNWVDRSASVNVTVDGTPPADATNLRSTSHTPNVWSNDDTVDFAWTKATDNLSGLEGYSSGVSPFPGVTPPAVQNLHENLTSVTETLSTSNLGRHFKLRSVDRSGNWASTFAITGPYLVDTVAPAPASGLFSPSHQVGVQSCDNNLTIQWTAATDAHAGLAGYRIEVDQSPTTDPTGALNRGPGDVTGNTTLADSASGWYVHLRARDNAGNWSSTVHAGPYLVDSNSVASYCTAKVNSAGCQASVSSLGQPSLSAGNFTVTCNLVVNNKNGLMFWGRTPGATPFFGGYKCVVAPTTRTPLQNSGGSVNGTDCSGSYAYTFTTAYMQSKGIAPGDTIYCQYWYRDPNVGVGTTDTSDALRFTVCQ